MAFIADLVAERVGAVVVGVRGISERTVGIEREVAVGWAGDQCRCQFVAVGVRVVGAVGQHVARQADVLGGGVHIRDSIGRAVEEGPLHLAP